MYYEDDSDKHGFDRIRTNFLLTEIFSFLNLSNVKVLLFVNKRFKNHLLKNDNQNLRTIGNFTYGLSK
jgi:hypothetical protein